MPIALDTIPRRAADTMGASATVANVAGDVSATSRTLGWTYVYGQPLPNTFANSGAVINLCRTLHDQGQNVAIAYAGPREHEASVREFYDLPEDVHFACIGHVTGWGHYPAMAMKAAIGLRTDILVTRMPQVAVMASVMRHPTILELHQPLETFTNWQKWRRFLNLVPKGMIAVAALTDPLAGSLDPLLAEKAKATTTIRSAAKDFAAPAGATPFDVGYLGSFMFGKGIERLHDLAVTLPGVRFVAYGDPSVRPDFAARLAALDNVTLGGFVRPADVGRALASFRIGLAPYSKKGFGRQGAAIVSVDSLSSLKVLEYMSAGRAIISSRIPAIETVITDGVNGLLCRAGDSEDWLQAVVRLLTDTKLCDRLGEEARKTYQGQFSYSARAKAFIDLAYALRAP